MTTWNKQTGRFGRLACGLLALALTMHTSAWAANGIWTESTGDGTWSNSANWSGGTIADGSGFTADFSQVDVSAVTVSTNYPDFYRNAIQVNTPRTISNLIFGDSNPATPGGWEVYTADPVANVITLAGATPTITVNPLGPIDTATLGDLTPEFIDDVIVRPNVTGTAGFTKQGTGVLTLAGTANTLAGNINVNAGTLRIANSYINTGVTPYNLAHGSTLEVIAGAVATVNVPAAATATLRGGATANVFMSNVVGAGAGAGSKLNVEFAGGSARTYSADNNWTGFDEISFTGTAGTTPFLRLRPNGGTFNNASWAITKVNLNNVNLLTRTNSQGNNIQIGELSGTATAVISGGNAGGGTAPRYVIGGLNTDSTYAGSFVGGGGAGGAGMSIDKVGTGKLTLSGTFTGSMISSNTDPGRQGGVIRVNQGTLALAGAATSIPGGFDANISTINVVLGATLDVTGTSTTFSSSPLQQFVGRGTVRGNFNHVAGTIRPADSTVVDNDSPLTNVPVATAGTMLFDQGTVSFNGGTIVYDTSLNPAGINDLIQVSNGNVDLGTGGKVEPNFLAGVPTSGTYTVINSAGGFIGSTSGWSVAWPGRGAPPTLVTNGNFLQFTAVPVTGGANLNWTGANSGNWDIQTTQNWRNNGSNANDVYFNDDNVTFADTHSGGTPVSNFTVTIATNVAPRSVTVDATNDYTLGGNGVITGTSTFTKRGTGRLTMQKTNTFSGAAAVEAGTVDIGASNAALGTGALTLGGGTIVGTVGNAGFTNSSLTLTAATSSTISMDGGAGVNGTVTIPNLIGSGTLTLTSNVNDKWYSLNNNSAFTGTINAGPDGVIGTSMTVRLPGAGASMPGAAVNLTNGASMSNRSGGSNVANIAIGALTGDATSSLTAFVGGGTLPGTNWIIGARNDTTTFAGTINDQTGGAISSVTKVGTGTLSLTGANLYTGNTTVEAGTLSMTNPFLADLADVLLTSGATMDLNFVGTDLIDELRFNGVGQVTGTWGSLASTATHKSAFFTGTGLLQVSTYVAPPSLVGDYNGNGVVDAADYTVWRDSLGSGTALANRDPLNTGNVSQADFISWRNNFGATLGSGAGSLATSAVPEPASLALVAMCVAFAAGGARRRGCFGFRS